MLVMGIKTIKPGDGVNSLSSGFLFIDLIEKISVLGKQLYLLG